MASFTKMGVWPAGYFRSYSSWLLRNRREVSARIATINAEVIRIGHVTVSYRTEKDADGNIKATEDRTGFTVTRNSSLERLIRAYIANGGNPMDISPFLHPDSTEVLDEREDGAFIVSEKYPYGGVIAPRSVDTNDPVPKKGETTGYDQSRGGMPRHSGYAPARQGGRVDRGAYDSNTVVRYMHQMRAWANQTIKERLQDIEWRIIKLCDLREQLERERDDVLMQAFGGALVGVASFDEDRFTPSLRVQNLVQDMYEVLYEKDADGSVRGFKPRQDIAFLRFSFDDTGSEILRDSRG